MAEHQEMSKGAKARAKRRANKKAKEAAEAAEAPPAPEPKPVTPEPKAKAKGKAKAEAKAEVKPEPKAEPKAKAKSEAKAKSKAEPEAKAKAKAKAGGLPLTDTGCGATEADMLHIIDEALPKIDYPDKNAVWKHVVQLGHRSERKFPSYKFIPRGGLSSPHVAYVTDIDFIFNNPQHGRISLKDFDALQRLASELCGTPCNIISAKIAWEDEDRFDDEVEDLEEVRRHVANGADVVVITGRYLLASGWQVPMDFTLQRGESRMSKERRLARIWDNIQEGNYAKVVSRIRALLSPSKKASFAKEWNRVGGALRFVVKQLELVKFLHHHEQVEYMPYLQIPSMHSVEAWTAVATKEMQRRALETILISQHLLGPELKGVVAALGVADRERDGKSEGKRSKPKGW